VLIFPKNVWWVIDRELLTAAVDNHDAVVGEGDVRFHPASDDPGSVLMELDSPQGWAVLRLWRDEIRAFLDELHGLPSRDPRAELEQWLSWAVQP